MQKKSTEKRTQTAARLIEEKNRVTEAVHEILHNSQTPDSLYEAVAEFVTETINRNGQDENILHSVSALTIILDQYPADELMGAVLAARKDAQ
jgi:hypothetical protein